MTPTAPATPPAAAPAARRFEPRRVARRGVGVVLANLAIGIVIWMVRGRGFVPGLVYAQCIGLSSWLAIEAGLRLRGADAGVASGTGWLGSRRTTLVVVGGCLFGYLAGATLASRLLGVETWTGALDHPTTLLADLLLTTGFGLVVGSLFVARSRAEAQRAQLEAAAHQATLARLAMLQSQLEPHMLFNTLANLRVLIGSRPDAAQAMLDRLIDFLRATLAGSRANAHPLRDEFARIDDYLALMQVRMGERLRVHSELPPALAAIEVPPLLLQPLVENAITHGIEPRRGPADLWVLARAEGGSLLLRVEDTGRGLDAARRDPLPDDRRAGGGHPGGFGLEQVRERLRTLHGDAASLALVPREGGGTIAEIRLPLPPQAARPPSPDATSCP